MNWCFLFSPFSSSFDNVALEYYLVHQSDELYLLMYINDDSVVIGKHQIAYAETNFDFLEKNNITLARRITGGGAVYHDRGNLNISLIFKASYVDMQLLLKPIVEFLRELKLDANINKKNDILIKDKKISGTAGHVFKNRVLQHCTLLINSDTHKLVNALKSDRTNFKGHQVVSKPSPVINLNDITNRFISINETKELLKHYFKKYINLQHFKQLTESQITQIKQLSEKKFCTWEWNFGYSPSFVFEDKISSDDKKIRCTVKNGLISECYILYNNKELICENLINKRFVLPVHKLLENIITC